MRKGTWFLRIVLGGLALLVIAVGLIPLPIMLREMFTHAPHHLNIVVVVLGIGIYLAIIGFLAAVFFAEQLLGVIDCDLAFSTTAVTYLTRVNYSSLKKRASRNTADLRIIQRRVHRGYGY